jgi:hypothetical protein
MKESPPEGYPYYPPPSTSCYRIFYTWWMAKCELHVRDLFARITCGGGGGEGRVICETVPFVNGSSDQLQIQNEDSLYHSALFLF